MTVNLNTRSFEPELMDGDDWSREEYFHCLRQLRLLNVLTNGYRPTFKALAHFAARVKDDQPLRILDIGFGYGDTLRAIANWAAKRDISVELVGIDLNGLSTEAAQAATPPELAIRYITGDVFAHKPQQPYHVVINALFMHHLDDARAQQVLRWMAEHATLGFFINDLHRHRIAYSFIRGFTRLFRFNRLIRNDAPLSVARAFRADEWPQHAVRAQLDPARLSVNWHWAFRYGVRYDHA
jgi:SAM-dependent methyltransferase